MAATHHQAGSEYGGIGRVRLLHDPALGGAANMARDEALLESVRRGSSGATLRWYAWAEPTISLGYFQPYAEYEALPAPAGALPVVRRLTGGGAILHDRELTYALVLPTSCAAARAAPGHLYTLMHDAVITALAQADVQAAACGFDDTSRPARGAFFCFARRHRCDVLLGGDKLAGSAQRRTREAVLQHGSIVIQRRFDQQPAAELAPAGLDAETLRSRLPTLLAHRLGADIIAGVWSESELVLVDSLHGKYAGDAWTRRK